MKITLFDSEHDWLTHKKGKASASNISRLLTKGKSDGLSVGAKTYVEELFAATVADDILDPYIDIHMQHGKDEEPVAIEEAGKLFPFQDIEHYGGRQFLFCELSDFAGCSPDALIYENAAHTSGIEVKCPTSKETHIYRLLNVKDNVSLLEHNKDIYAQIQMNMMCFGAKEWHFASYYSFMHEPKLRLHIVKIEPDEAMQELIRVKISQAQTYFNELRESYNALLA